MPSIHAILDELRVGARSKRDQGDRFERLIAAYLRTDPLYKARFSDVWLWNEWPERGHRPDTGIDLVARERETEGFCAIQCKFFDPDHYLQKGDIDSFFTASGKAPFTTRLLVSTTDRWSKHAEDALTGQTLPVTRLRVQDLAESPIDWSRFSLRKPEDIQLRKRKDLRPHQQVALGKVRDGFRTSARGKLIMACGTGKTFTALRIAEELTPKESATVLFLVPSISLLSQSLREWTSEASRKLRAFAVCSDTQVGRPADSEDLHTHDLAFPATTNAALLAKAGKHGGNGKLTVVFSTYQSIQAVADAQKKGLPEFDLIICDEAHRTTGVKLADEDESHFVRVHDGDFVRAQRRLYMTATPRIFSDVTKTKAEENDAEIASMDDERLYGPEFHRLGFSEAVASGLLTDYKVMVLAVDEKYVSRTFQKQLADEDSELRLEDAVKITGCWNGLAKRFTEDSAATETDPAPMKRAVAFCRSIKDSKRITGLFGQVVESYIKEHPEEPGLLRCEVDHVDGTFNALARNARLDWLKAESGGDGICRVLSNARCLSEGVDVPALDAVMFLNPRNSVVDVVQSVGRVMRRAEGKQYGYIILPIGIPADMRPDEALKNNQKYKVVWQVLQALRAHDDRFNATINQLELNKTRPPQIQVVGVSGRETEGTSQSRAPNGEGQQYYLAFPQIGEWRDAIYARIVEKCGDRRYWETWAKDVAEIAERHVARISALVDGKGSVARRAFAEFLAELQASLNPSVSRDDAIEMLSQHLITRPVFDALFDGHEFTRSNPVSVAMQKMLDALQEENLEKETVALESFYESVRIRARGIDNAEGKQRIVIELYDKFFRTAFPRTAERLGIVYTPVEIVDFIIHSVQAVLTAEFGVGLSAEGVHVLDPFTGTGTFLVRLLQSGLIARADLRRKYLKELHANELVLLAYYIAAVNIESTYHALSGAPYESFPGIVLTDTFQMTETRGTTLASMFPENNRRAALQNETDIRVVIGNPPWSVGQESQNDGNVNLEYPQLDERIRQTYAASSSADLVRNLYDSYIRAFRWASDRLKERGVIAFVSNGAIVSKKTMDGFRKCVGDEFTSIYCFDLRGDQRTQGVVSRMEGGKVFGSGSRAGVAITVLVRNPSAAQPRRLLYHDIGDYLTAPEKLQRVAEFQSVKGVPWVEVTPNAAGDWVRQRGDDFGHLLALGEKDRDRTEPLTVFSTYASGIVTNRDAWAYGFSAAAVAANMRRMSAVYNQHVIAYRKANSGRKKAQWLDIESFIDRDERRIKWSRGLKNALKAGRDHPFSEERIVRALYRPFCKKWVYFDRGMNELVGELPEMFPGANSPNLAICVPAAGTRRAFSVLMTDTLPDSKVAPDGTQFFPRFVYAAEGSPTDLFQATSGDQIGGRREAITDAALNWFRVSYARDDITKEDIFFYVYGVLHSPDYRDRFANELKVQPPRIPLSRAFDAFAAAGRRLSALHVGYETAAEYPLREQWTALTRDPGAYRVTRMQYAREGKKVDKSCICVNSSLMLAGIPPEAHEYVINGRTPLEWVMDQYEASSDRDSGIASDPNDASSDPMYIVGLLKKAVTVAVESVRIIRGLTGKLDPAAAEDEAPRDILGRSIQILRRTFRLEPAEAAAFIRRSAEVGAATLDGQVPLAAMISKDWNPEPARDAMLALLLVGWFRARFIPHHRVCNGAVGPEEPSADRVQSLALAGRYNSACPECARVVDGPHDVVIRIRFFLAEGALDDRAHA